MNKIHSIVDTHLFEGSFKAKMEDTYQNGKMPQLSIETQLQIMVATFVLHNYIGVKSTDNPLYRVLEEYLDFIPMII